MLVGKTVNSKPHGNCALPVIHLEEAKRLTALSIRSPEYGVNLGA